MPIEAINGIALFCEEAGAGEPVVLVHGTTGSSADWVFVAPLLAADFRVITYDRRGRGQSGDGPSYSLEQEASDLRAVIDRVGTPVHLVGHSLGARLAMLAAPRNAAISTLVLYEPPLEVDAEPAGTWEAIDEATRAHDWEQVLARFYPLAGITPDEIAVMRAVPPAWEAALDGARTVAREVHALRESPVDVDLLRDVAAPSLVLRGGETTSPVFLDGLDRVAGALRAPIERIEGQHHLATIAVPDVFAAAVREFIMRSRP